MIQEKPTKKFDIGRVLITPAAQDKLDNQDVISALGRHVIGDWGDCGKEDKAENELSVREGFRILSVYHGRNGSKFWIITEADRSATIVLLPEDY
jgi:hypothetical protein